MESAEIQPVYQRIWEDLKKEIFSGTLAPGTMLPSENKLCARYGVTRETVRKGMQALAQDGLIYSKPKVGYFVSSPDSSSVLLSFGEAFSVLSSRYNRASIIRADAAIADALDLKEGDLIVELRRTVCRDDRTPEGFAIMYIPYKRGNPSLEQAMVYTVDPASALSRPETFSVFSSVELSAVNADRKLAGALQCPEGEALLLYIRTYMNQNRKKIARELLYLRQPAGKLTGTIGIEL